jgi:hypothetical protein
MFVQGADNVRDKWSMLLYYEKVACATHSNKQDLDL